MSGAIKIAKIKDLVGQKFGRLTVLYFDQLTYDEEKQKGKYVYKWFCECECKEHDKNIVNISQNNLISGDTQSCGCLIKENNTGRIPNLNKYKLLEKYGIGWASNNNKPFYFDLEDYELIKNYTWSENKLGYIVSSSSNFILLHRLVMGVIEFDKKIDHIYGNKHDNRKEFLRIVTNQQNNFNKKVKGVWFDKERNKWQGYLRFNGKNYMKRFDTYEEALEYRKQLEEIYFKTYSYQEPPPEYIEELNKLSEIN